MKKRSITFILTGALLATMLPAVAVAGGPKNVPEGMVPGCKAGFWEWAYDPVPPAGVKNPGWKQADKNGDGLRCYQIAYHPETSQIVAYHWTDNKDWKNPIEPYWP
jgi:hypothetical protein